jgi:hypothetical protein
MGENFARVALALALALALMRMCLGNPATALAQASAPLESCNACKYRACLESLLEQKKSLREGYENLAQKWEGKWLDAEGKPRAQVDLEADYPDLEMRKQILAVLASQMLVFDSDVRVMMNVRLKAPDRCGITDKLEMSTDSVLCVIDVPKMEETEKASPCKEVFEIAKQHEALHQERCALRKGARARPAVRLPPAGLAREEAAAYALEITELDKVYRQARKLCKPTCNGPWHGTITVKKETSFSSHKTILPHVSGAITDGGNTDSSDVTVFEGTIAVDGKTALAEVTGSESYQEDSHVFGRVLCSSRRGLQATSGTSKTTRSASGSAKGSTSVNVSLLANRYAIYLVPPKIPTTLQMSWSRSSTGSCRDDPPESVTSSKPTVIEVAPFNTYADYGTDPDRNVLSDTITVSQTNPSTSSTKTDTTTQETRRTTTLSWNLRCEPPP